MGIIRRAGDHSYGAWELVYDFMIFHGRRHRYGNEPEWEGRLIRVDEPRDMVRSESVPFDQRDRLSAEAQERARERRAQVNKLADEFVTGDRNHYDLRTDFSLEREVMDELWRRWREATGDRFLLNALSTQPQSDPGVPSSGSGGES